MKSKTTSFDIAYRAGVSQSTVSRALRNSPLVNEETRKRIQAIARELHYTVDKNASNLRSQHSDTLAVLLFEDPTSDDSQINPFFLSMIGSITRGCSRRWCCSTCCWPSCWRSRAASTGPTGECWCSRTR